MKKFLAILAIIALAAGSMSARDKVYNSAEPLPQAAKTMLATYFPSQKVNHVKVDSDVFSKEYEVILNDGTEVDFNKDGEWKSIDRGQKAVPAALVLKPISDFVAANYSGAKIVDIEKDRNSYDITLANGIELKLDRSGKFLKVDD